MTLDADRQLELADGVVLPLSDIELTAIRARGAGGQHVNKTATAVQLRLDIPASSLPERWKAALLAQSDHRLTGDGVLVLRAESERSQERNRREALERLRAWLVAGTRTTKARKATKPTRAAKRRRLDAKRRRGEVKTLRGSVKDD